MRAYRFPLIMAIGLSLPGCAFIKPTTQIRISPLTKTVEITNTKDVNIATKGVAVEWQEGSGKFTVDELTVSDMSSPVVTANVQQMLAFAEQQRAANEGIIGALTEMRNTVNILAGLLHGSTANIDTPIGSASGTLGTPQPAE